VISLWNRAVSPALANPLRVTARWDTDPPPALAWTLRNDRLVVALAAAISAIIWYLVEPIVVTHDTFAYLIAAWLQPPRTATPSTLSRRSWSPSRWDCRPIESNAHLNV
jgi:hypothetical protein